MERIPGIGTVVLNSLFLKSVKGIRRSEQYDRYRTKVVCKSISALSTKVLSEIGTVPVSTLHGMGTSSVAEPKLFRSAPAPGGNLISAPRLSAPDPQHWASRVPSAST
jgi:hypothetical protein